MQTTGWSAVFDALVFSKQTRAFLAPLNDFCIFKVETSCIFPSFTKKLHFCSDRSGAPYEFSASYDSVSCKY